MLRWCALLALVSVLVSCRAAEDVVQNVKREVEPRPDARLVGVFVLDSTGLRELKQYGAQEDGDSFTTGVYTRFQFPDSFAPEKSTQPRAFYVNLPDARITESKVYRLTDLDAKWHNSQRHAANDPKPLPTRLEIVESSLYKVLLPDGADTTHPVLALRVAMPMGTLDRLYVIADSSAISGRGEVASFTFVGNFGNSAEINAHFNKTSLDLRQPYLVSFWRDSVVGLVGQLTYPVREADSPRAYFEKSEFNPATGDVAFQARLWAGSTVEGVPVYEVHEFKGRLIDGELRGRFARRTVDAAGSPDVEPVVLKKESDHWDYAAVKSLAQWKTRFLTQP
jgi:hypothetical protein